MANPDVKRRKLGELLDRKQLVRVIEAHNGISASVASNVKIELTHDGQNEILEFDALWASSLTDSTSKGLPDIEIVSLDSRLATIEQMLNVTDKPIIVDGDTGRSPDSFRYFITKLERLGVSAIVVEDKAFPKRNSLDPDVLQKLEDPNVFLSKIKIGRDGLFSKDFMIFARIESLIAGYGIQDALFRAKKYLESGIDGIMIHSREENPVSVIKFAVEYNTMCEELDFRKPLICIPTTYNFITEKQLRKLGFNIAIYANHLLRASVKSMEDVGKLILLNGRAFETEPYCTPIDKLFDMVGFTEIKHRDLETLKKSSKTRVIVLAAGKPKEEIIKSLPTAMLDINGRTLLQRQLDVLKQCGITNATITRGYEKKKFDVNHVKYCDIKEFERGSLFSLLAARDDMQEGFIMIFSDIIFDESIVNNLLRSKEDITILVDASYPFHRHEIEKELDLIISKRRDEYYRDLLPTVGKEVSFIGKKIKKQIATHEFIGIAKFSKYGAQNLIMVYEDCKKNHKGRFHENESFEKASIIDLLQEMIDRGFKVHYIETNKGWMEIHNKKDYELAKKTIY